MVTINRGCCPKPGDIGTLSPLTGVTEMHPVLEPPGKVAEPGATVSEKPGDWGSVRVPPWVASTQSWFTVSRAGRKIGTPTVLSCPATVTMSYSRVGKDFGP